jgi:hypothetical protein
MRLWLCFTCGILLLKTAMEWAYSGKCYGEETIEMILDILMSDEIFNERRERQVHASFTAENGLMFGFLSKYLRPRCKHYELCVEKLNPTL